MLMMATMILLILLKFAIILGIIILPLIMIMRILHNMGFIRIPPNIL